MRTYDRGEIVNVAFDQSPEDYNVFQRGASAAGIGVRA